jgi:large subunit ribosomal protein L24
MKKIKSGDEVQVITGRNKGQRGKILRILTENKIVVEGVNVAKRHVRPNPSQGIAGGIVEKEMGIHISNVMLFNSRTQKADRVGIKSLEDGRKVRYFKSDNEVID